MNTRTQAEQVAGADLAACAADVLAWQRSGRLGAGSALHKVADIWAADPVYSDDCLQQAERTVIKLALQRAAASKE